MTIKHQPATPLPFGARTGYIVGAFDGVGHETVCEAPRGWENGRRVQQNMAYLVHAANSYQKMVGALRAARSCTVDAANRADRLLRELGEAE